MKFQATDHFNISDEVRSQEVDVLELLQKLADAGLVGLRGD